MATNQKAKEKEQFFEDLSRLDQLSDDDLDGCSPFLFKKSHVAPQRPISAPEKPIAVQTSSPEPVPDAKMNKSRRKRKAVAEDKTTPMPTLRTVNTEPERIRPSSSIVRGTKKAKPARLRRSKSDLDKTDPLWRKGDPPLAPIPEDRQIFLGFTFCFVPYDDRKLISLVYRFRIQKSIQFGAKWVKEWNSDVTHIIVCGGLNASQVSKCFGGEKIPDQARLVHDDWVVDSIRSKYPPDIASERYQVEGWLNQVVRSVEKSTTSIKASNLESHDRTDAIGKISSGTVDSETKTLHPDALLGTEQSQVEGIYHDDDLQNAIMDVQNFGDLPLDPSFDADSANPSDEVEDESELEDLRDIDSARKENAGFQCMEKHDGNDNNPNSRTIELLQQMAARYDRGDDHWRTMAYRKGISALRKQTKLIRTKEEAFAIPQIGNRLAAKIQEIASTDRLQTLEKAKLDPNEQVLQLFMGIYHVGYPTASRWIAQGHRTLDDLYHKAELNQNQRIGIEHYDDFLQRIPRAEVAEHAAVVEKVLKAADDGLRMIIGGSYRRGSKDSGDIDLIITKEDASLEHVRTLMMELVVPQLTDHGFLKAALAAGNFDTSSKWHGACALPESKVWRRIDLLFVPWAELGAALIYFTGNDIFNRSLRLLASRKQMRLNQRGLYADVMRGRGRERVTDGELLESHNERRIFEILGVPYRPPEHRCP